MFETDNDFTIEELEELLNGDIPQATEPASTTPVTPSETQSVQPTVDNIEKTKVFAKRLNERTKQAIAKEREDIAKTLGYASYDDMVKKREQQVIADKGLDPEQVSPIVEELVNKRLAEDPRLKELELLKAQKVVEFSKRELAEITDLTNGEITDIKQLPKEVLELWKQKGSLKSAYIEVEGEKLIKKFKSEQSKGSTAHLNSLSSNNMSDSNKRHLTDDEKKLWKYFNPSMTDEELEKKMIEK